MANPPFGGKERQEVQQNFPVKTGETAFLFLQHFIKTLKAGGRAAIVIKNTFLSNTENSISGPSNWVIALTHPAAATGTASAAASRLWVASACPTTWSML